MEKAEVWIHTVDSFSSCISSLMIEMKIIPSDTLDNNILKWEK